MKFCKHASVLMLSIGCLVACSPPNLGAAMSNPGNPVTPTTLPGDNNGSGGILSSKKAGTFDDQCLSKAEYDACIIWKNPVAQRGSAFTVLPEFGIPLKEQTFGVKIKGLANEFSLANSSIHVTATSAPLAGSTPETSWRFPYGGDASNHFLAQVMAYFWLNFQDEEMMKRAGNFYAHGKDIEVDAYNSNVVNNAFWDGQKITLGVATVRGTPTLEIAMGAEIYLHEMGHANLKFAMNQNLIDPNAQGGNCLTEAGCITGLSEGIADFHSLMIFWDSTALGETAANSPAGVSQNNISRDVTKVTDLTFADFFNRSNGEIHGMGTGYASVLWQIYTNPLVDRMTFEKIFMESLNKFTNSSRLLEARDILISEDLNINQGKYNSIISKAFSDRGL